MCVHHDPITRVVHKASTAPLRTYSLEKKRQLNNYHEVYSLFIMVEGPLAIHLSGNCLLSSYNTASTVLELKIKQGRI